MTTSPFTLAKSEDTKPRAGAVLHHLLEALFVTAVLLRPFLPESSARIIAMLQLPPDVTLPDDWQWGQALPDRHTAGKPEILFPRIET